MNVLNERFLAIRKALGVTQKEMGDALGLSSSGISNIEQGVRNVTKKHIRLLNAVFHVSKNWMENGMGSMFIQTDDTLLSRLALEYGMDEGQKELMRCFLSLTNEQRAAVVYFVCHAASRIGDARPDCGGAGTAFFPSLGNEPELSKDEMQEIERELSQIRQYKIMERKANYAARHLSDLRGK